MKTIDHSLAKEMTNKILAKVMIFRRTLNSTNSCRDINCSKCSFAHFEKIISAVKKNEPISFVLPAFPGKSPNPEKVLGHLPDLAERLSLQFLEDLCQEIRNFYAPGMRIILCSDGRVFSDVVGMKEENVSAYQVELDLLIEEMSLSNLSTFNLDDFYEKLNFVEMRERLMERFGRSLDSLKLKVRNGAKPSATAEEIEANRMYCGITRFLFEDSTFAGQTKSRSSIQRESRSKSYEVIRRSNAWSELIAELFPDSVRLSIHPQVCGAKKLGIRLIGNESWMTPWHGVAVETREGYTLLKNSEAKEMGGELILSSHGRPSHYKLVDESSLSQNVSMTGS